MTVPGGVDLDGDVGAFQFLQRPLQVFCGGCRQVAAGTLGDIEVADDVAEAAAGHLADEVEVTPVLLGGVVGEMARPRAELAAGVEVVDGADDVVPRISAHLGGEKVEDVRDEIHFEAEQDLDPAAVLELQFEDALDVVIEFRFAHTDVGAEPVGEGVVAGETDFAQAEFDGAFDVRLHRAGGVLAERRVCVVVGGQWHKLRTVAGQARIDNPAVRIYYPAPMETPVVFESKGQQIVGMMHLPDGRGRVPGVLLLHGFMGTKSETHRLFVKLARKLAAHGIASLRFDFRGSGDSAGEFEEATIHTQVADATEALKFLARQKRINAKRLAVVGFSLGGAIAAHAVGRERGRVKSLVLLSPVAEGAGILDDLATPEAVASLAQTGITDYGGNLVGVEFIRQFADMKPLREVVKVTCPVLLIHGQKDETVPAHHSDLYERALHNAKRIVKKVVIPGADHTFNKHLWQERILTETVDWLGETL